MIGASFTHKKAYHTWLLLKITYGLLFIVAGADKLFNLNLIVNWAKYVSPAILQLLPLQLMMLLKVVAVIEILLGLLVLTKFTRLGAYLISIWFLIIVVNLLTTLKFFDIAARDTVLAVGAIALAKLTEIKNEIK